MNTATQGRSAGTWLGPCLRGTWRLQLEWLVQSVDPERKPRRWVGPQPLGRDARRTQRRKQDPAKGRRKEATKSTLAEE